MNLLLMDDEKLFVKGLTKVLKEGFKVFAAFEGMQALEILESGKLK